MDKVNKVLTESTPYNASISIDWEEPANGWNAPKLAPWLDKMQFKKHLKHFMDRPALSMGEGGTIPFMAMLGEKFPEAQFVITGVLGSRV